MWPGFGSRGATSGGFCEMLPEASPCPAKTIPGSSKRDVLVAEEGSIGNCVNASVVMMPWEG